MYNKKEKVLEWLTVLANEMEYLTSSPLQGKYKVMLLMVYIDIFSQIWDLVQTPKAKNQKDRFTNWLDKFWFVAITDDERNELIELQPLDSSKLYAIRNSLLHFGGLPNLEIPVFISEFNKKVFITKYEKQIDSFYNTHTHLDRTKGILILYPSLLYRKAIKAFIETLKELMTRFPDGSHAEQMMFGILFKKLEENHALPINVSS